MAKPMIGTVAVRGDRMEFQKPSEYQTWLTEIKNRIVASRIKAALAASRELVTFYFELGWRISEKQREASWGDKVIPQLSADLKKAFPDLQGVSSSNLKYCKRFYEFYALPNGQQSVDLIDASSVVKFEQVALAVIGQQLVDQIPWGHNIQVFTKSVNLNEAAFYINQTIHNGWSREVLAQQIKSDLYGRSGKTVSNFKQTLPIARSELVQQTLKDPYVFDFLSLTAPYNERDIERQLVKHMTKFLLELGKGFAFVGQQYTIEVDGTDYFIDLLFYHTVLKCYVVVELKNTKFISEYAGKLNFYLSAVDSLVKQTDDNPTIGLLLCRDKSNIEVEFALRDMSKPMGVSEYNFTEVLPDELKGSLPTVEEIEADRKLLDESDGEQDEDPNAVK